jgi:hypothetical protein
LFITLENYISFGIDGFLGFVHRLVFERTERFENWIYFHPQVSRWEMPA